MLTIIIDINFQYHPSLVEIFSIHACSYRTGLNIKQLFYFVSSVIITSYSVPPTNVNIINLASYMAIGVRCGRVKFICLLTIQPVSTDWKKAIGSLRVDNKVKEVSWAVPGAKAGLAKLEEFCSKKLKQFATNRNDPTTDNLSGLSPWLHFGEFNVARA